MPTVRPATRRDLPAIARLMRWAAAETAATFAAGIITSTVVGLFAIAFLLKYVRNHTFLPFVIYRCALGAVVLVVAATGLR